MRFGQHNWKEKWIMAVFILALMISGCKDPWKNFTAEGKAEVINGCQLLWPVEFTAIVDSIEYIRVNIKTRPRWMHATVISGKMTPSVQRAMTLEGHHVYDLADWPSVKIDAAPPMFYLFEVGDTLVKPMASCSVFNTANPDKRESLYGPFR